MTDDGGIPQVDDGELGARPQGGLARVGDVAGIPEDRPHVGVRRQRQRREHGTGGEIYNVCSGQDVSIEDLADRLVAMASRPMRLVPDPDLQRPVDIPVLRGDNSRLCAATGWTPRISLDESLRDLLAQCRSAFDATN